MKADSSNAIRLLSDLHREDRADARIWRSKIENIAYGAVAASFTLSSFLISKIGRINHWLIFAMTLTADFGIIAIAWHIRTATSKDLQGLRKDQHMRQSLLEAIEDGKIQDISPFADPNEAGMNFDHVIRDADLDRLVYISLGIVFLKMVLVAIFAWWLP
jgi:hypothetical protein